MPRKSRRSKNLPVYSYNPSVGYQQMPSGHSRSAELPPPPSSMPSRYSISVAPHSYMPPGLTSSSMIPLQIIPFPDSSYNPSKSVPGMIMPAPRRSLGPPPPAVYEKSVGSAAAGAWAAAPHGPLIQNEIIQLFAFITISAIHEFMYSSKIRAGVAAIRGSEAHLEKKMLRDVYSFFLKGGAAPPILEHLFAPEFMLPVPIEADIDTTLLVNPAEPKFVEIRNFLIHELIRFLSVRLLESPSGWREIVGIYRAYGLDLDTRELGIKIDAKGAMDSGSIKLFSAGDGIVTGDRRITDFRFPTGSPFKLEVQTSISYRGSSVGLTLLKVLTKTSPAIELLDIAIPNTAFGLLGFEWKAKKLLPIELLDTRVRFYISDLFTTLADQRVGIRLDTRRNKVARREARAARLARTIRNLQSRGAVRSKMVELGPEVLEAAMPNGTPFGALIDNIE